MNGATFCLEFEKGTYIIIPYSNQILQTSYQFFNLDFFVEKEEAFTFNKAKLTEFYFNGKKSNEDEKCIQKLESKEKYEKPRN